MESLVLLLPVVILLVGMLVGALVGAALHSTGVNQASSSTLSLLCALLTTAFLLGSAPELVGVVTVSSFDFVMLLRAVARVLNASSNALAGVLLVWALVELPLQWLIHARRLPWQQAMAPVRLLGSIALFGGLAGRLGDEILRFWS